MLTIGLLAHKALMQLYVFQAQRLHLARHLRYLVLVGLLRVQHCLLHAVVQFLGKGGLQLLLQKPPLGILHLEGLVKVGFRLLQVYLRFAGLLQCLTSHVHLLAHLLLQLPLVHLAGLVFRLQLVQHNDLG